MSRSRDLSNSGHSIGTTSNRPSSPFIGMEYYDTTLGQMLNYTINNTWVAVGTASTLSPYLSNLALYVDAGNSSSYSGSGTTITDLSGNGNTGTFTSSSITYSSSNGGYLNFPGSQWISFGNPSSLNISSQITIMVAFQPSNFASNWSTLVGKGDSSWRFQGNQNSTNLDFGTSGLTNTDTGSATALTNGTWYIAHAIYNGSSKQIYINNSLDASQSNSGTISTNGYNVYIGENSQATGRTFQGKIGAVLIYNTGLNSTQVTQNYNYFKSRYGLS